MKTDAEISGAYPGEEVALFGPESNGVQEYRKDYEGVWRDKCVSGYN